jgi:hypothetical protein
MTLPTENPNDSSGKQIQKCFKIHSQHKNSGEFLCTNSELFEKEIKKTITFIIAKNM